MCSPRVSKAAPCPPPRCAAGCPAEPAFLGWMEVLLGVSAAQGGGGWRNGLSSGRRYLKQRAFRNPTFNQVFGEGRSISRFQRKSSVPCHFSMCTSLQKGELAYWENKIKIEPFMAERGSAEVEVHQVWTEQLFTFLSPGPLSPA